MAEKEKGDLMTQLTDRTQQFQEETDRWEAEKKRLLERCSELKAQLEQDAAGKGTQKDGYFSMFKNRKEQQRRRKEKEEWNQFILAVISNPEFSKEQLDFIIQAVQSELTLQELRQMCNPKLEVRSMELLEQFYLRQRGGKAG